MRMNNEIIWNHAEKLAKLISEAYKNIQKNGQSWEKQIADENIKELNKKSNKRRFIAICTNFVKFAPKDDNFLRIMTDVVSLNSETFVEDKDISFEMFITCFRFHLACHESEWSKED